MVNSLVLIFSHIIPPTFGIISLLLLITGVMEKQNVITALGVCMFFVAGLLPFVVLPWLGI